MGAFCIIVGVQGVLKGSIAIEASHLNILRGAYCITSAGHIKISVFNIPSCQYCIIMCANYTIISGKRNIMGRLVPSHTCLIVAKLKQNQYMNHVLGILGLFIFLYQ